MINAECSRFSMVMAVVKSLNIVLNASQSNLEKKCKKVPVTFAKLSMISSLK